MFLIIIFKTPDIPFVWSSKQISLAIHYQSDINIIITVIHNFHEDHISSLDGILGFHAAYSPKIAIVELNTAALARSPIEYP